MANPFKLLADLSKKLPMIPSQIATGKKLSDEDLTMVKKIGLTMSELTKDIQTDTQVQWDRMNLYHQIDRSLDHWMMSSATELYADFATNYSSLHNASVWVTSEDAKYARVLNKFLQETVGIEEKIFDWAYTTASYGNLFVKINGVPGTGVVSISDNEHPLNLSRVDHEGILVGFYRTPLGAYTGNQKLLAPWEYVHFRLLGAKKKRSEFGDQSYTEFRSMYLLSGMSQKQATTRYGTSLLINALPVYKRLRLAEDSLLMARLTRGIIRYVWKLKVDSSNQEAVGELVEQYARLLKRARALDTSDDSPGYDSKANPMASIEDIFIPVWGETGDLDYSKIGEDADIRWIVDIEELRNQLACSLRTPLSLLGGFVKEASGSLGSDSIEQLDIRFARSSRRLQRSLKEGISRICQIHLAYMNMDPDSSLFEVNMSETSTAEEAQLVKSLETGISVVAQVLDTLDGIEGLDKIAIINYLNQKMLKLEDFDLNDYMEKKEIVSTVSPVGIDGEEGGGEFAEGEVPPEEGIAPGEGMEKGEAPIESTKKDLKHPIIETVFNTDSLSYLPITYNEKTGKHLRSWISQERHMKIWEKKFGSAKVLLVDDKGEELEKGKTPKYGDITKEAYSL